MFQKIYNKCRDKNIIVYLPDDYYQSEERYPVLYMNDGQNAFFDDQAYIGVSWGMEDYLKKSGLKVIVVAIPASLVNMVVQVNMVPGMLTVVS